MTQRAVFGQLDYTATDWLKIIAGVRLEHLSVYSFERITGAGTDFETRDYGQYDVNQVDVIPRMALIVSPRPSERIKIMYGQATNRPSFFQNYQTIFAGFPTLKPEVVHTFEVNYLSAYSKNLTVGISYFHNMFDDLIVRTIALDLDSDVYTSYSSNDGKMVTDGCEVLLTAKPNRNSIVEIAGTYQHTRDRREGWENREVPNSPKFLGYFKASFNLTNSICLALTANYVSSMECQWDELKVNADGTLGGRIGSKVGSSTVATCNLRIKDVLIKGGYLNLHIYNLFESENRYPTHTNSLWADKGTIGKGRTVLFSIGKTF
jgi:outer membrane receptor protein involved in Fe transport